MLPDLAGATLGPYRLERLLGEGEMGVVYRATEQSSDTPVALRVLAPDLVRQPGFLPRFVAETTTIARLAHPGIVPVYEIGTRARLTYLSMRLVEGCTLRDLLAEGTPDLTTTWRILHAVAGALQSAHDVGVVHRDLKPGNVLVEAGGPILVTGFGLARLRYG